MTPGPLPSGHAPYGPSPLCSPAATPPQSVPTPGSLHRGITSLALGYEAVLPGPSADNSPREIPPLRDSLSPHDSPKRASHRMRELREGRGVIVGEGVTGGWVGPADPNQADLRGPWGRLLWGGWVLFSGDVDPVEPRASLNAVEPFCPFRCTGANRQSPLPNGKETTWTERKSRINQEVAAFESCQGNRATSWFGFLGDGSLSQLVQLGRTIRDKDPHAPRSVLHVNICVQSHIQLGTPGIPDPVC
uniref:Uncharacterized protein n=1 Tax=Knipowitschia caucasica TaxID=637954 RepID=A0AAV2LGC4_KNICA